MVLVPEPDREPSPFGFSGLLAAFVWVLLCRFKVSLRANCLEQILHWNAFSSVWVLLCSRR